MLIKDDILTQWTENAIEILRPVDKITSQTCPFCHRPIRFPVIVRESDMIAFRTLFELAEIWLVENGVRERMLNDLMGQIKDRLNLQ